MRASKQIDQVKKRKDFSDGVVGAMNWRYIQTRIKIRHTTNTIGAEAASPLPWSHAPTIFGARNLFRFNARWSRGVESFMRFAVGKLKRTEVRAPGQARQQTFLMTSIEFLASVPIVRSFLND